MEGVMKRREDMRPLWVAMIVGVIVMGLLYPGNVVFAADNVGGGVHSGGFHQGGGHFGGDHFRGDHGRGHFGSRFDVVIGGPFWDPWFYPYYPYYPYYSYSPYYYPYYSQPAGEPSMSEEYIERSQERPSYNSSTPAGVWYYCPKSRAYYPYVKKCPGGWQTVPAEPSEEER
jgi:hypothetical protein